MWICFVLSCQVTVISVITVFVPAMVGCGTYIPIYPPYLRPPYLTIATGPSRGDIRTGQDRTVGGMEFPKLSHLGQLFGLFV